jgi:phage tail sheath protein FI
MSFQLSPGVVVTEEDRTNFVPSVATTAGAFAGAFQWGPVEEVTTIDTETNLVSKFGKPNDTTAGYFFTAANFLSYGNNLQVVRVVNKGIARNAVSTPSGVITAISLSPVSNTFLTASNIIVSVPAPTIGTNGATGNVTLKSTGSITKIIQTDYGTGYNTAPTISLTGGNGINADIVAVLGTGSITSITVQEGGNNYSSASTVGIQDQGFTSANAVPVIHYRTIELGIGNGGTNYGPQANIQFSGNIVAGGIHATAIPSLTGNIITGYTITSTGNGYIGSPNVIINRNDGNTGVDAAITANIGHGYVDSITIVNNGGGGYSYCPTVTIYKNSLAEGANASATARISATVFDITLVDGGSGFTSNPIINIIPAADDVPFVTSNAAALAVVEYEIDRVNVVSQGKGYATAPTVTISQTGGFTANATSTLAFNPTVITNEDNYNAYHSTGGFANGEFAAKYVGVLGNSIKVSFADSNTYSTWEYASNFDSAPGTSSYAGARGGANDEMHIIVLDADGTWTGTANAVLEKYSYVSKANDAKNSDGSTNYYKDIINNQSQYLWWLDHPTIGTNWGSASSTTFVRLNSAITKTLGGGVSSDAPTTGNVAAGYALFSNDELYDVSLIPMGPTTDVSTVNTVIGIAGARRDCVVFASPPYTDVVNAINQADNIVAYRNQLTDSSYAVLDSGWKYQYDRYNDKYRYVPLNGDIAGLAARTDYIADPWFSPAGYNRGVIKNVVKLAYSPSKTDRDTLYKKGINPVVTFPGQGTLLFGDKTLQSRPSAFDRINVRRLFIVLEKAISTASKFQLFEFNDPFTRGQFKNLVEPFLRDVQGRRGITDFRVVCDETNNPAAIIDTNQFVADIYIKPARSINFIQLNFIATRTGVSFEEVGA